jgi:hypothetical protein
MPYRPASHLVGTTELECLGHKNTRTLLELHKPLATLTCPDVALVTVLVLGLLSLDPSNFDQLQIMAGLDFLTQGVRHYASANTTNRWPK